MALVASYESSSSCPPSTRSTLYMQYVSELTSCEILCSIQLVWAACLQVIVVDVEDRDDSVWHNLTPLDGGLSGWRLLWDRWCPIPSLRFCPFPPETDATSGVIHRCAARASLRAACRLPVFAVAHVSIVGHILSVLG